MTASTTSDRIQQIPVSNLQPNPLQPRGVITQESLAELVESERRYGIIEPLVIAHTPAGYQIVAGERRWRAAKLAGLETVPAVVKETSLGQMLEMAIIENVQRVDLNPIDRAKAFQRLEREFHLTVAQIAERISKSSAYISNSIRLLKLPDALKDGILGQLITEGHARALAAIEDHRKMVEAYKMVLKESASVRRTEEIARRIQAAAVSGDEKTDGEEKRKAPVVLHEEIDAWTSKLQTSFGENAKVKITRSKRETRIVIKLHGSPEKTQKQVEKLLESV